MNKNFDSEKDGSLRPKKRRKKNIGPYKKDKYSLSKLIEYENYLSNIELMSKTNNPLDFQ
ncbi:hypothetical protein EGM88_04925 [Aureibaculum marinum]|uniref:Uncharacterized protein n=1 Tax=Aureibaculum marinum TaxID=2487930 RepID=A0A3N4NQ99_9FLAO|nr:hypothetical protein [Aureibaculum marinum]RPD98542.1 hypothetical protein EGM88_04925 [Aureibaculum marinum]